MNIKHIINIKESLLFLSICRDTLYEMYENKNLSYFIKNEASDYQIISIIASNEIPIEKYNLKEEYKQWEIFQHIICNDSELFVEMGPIVEHGLSSCKPILNHLSEVDGDQGKYVQGLYDDMKTSMKSLKSVSNKGKAAAAKTAVDNSNAPLDKIAVGVNSGTAASIISFSAAKLYKDYLGRAIKACKGRPDKVNCMKQFKEKALNMRIEKLRSGMSTCNKASNVDACKKSLQKQLDRLQAKTEK